MIYCNISWLIIPSAERRLTLKQQLLFSDIRVPVHLALRLWYYAYENIIYAWTHKIAQMSLNTNRTLTVRVLERV